MIFIIVPVCKLGGHIDYLLSLLQQILLNIKNNPLLNAHHVGFGLKFVLMTFCSFEQRSRENPFAGCPRKCLWNTITCLSHSDTPKIYGRWNMCIVTITWCFPTQSMIGRIVKGPPVDQNGNYKLLVWWKCFSNFPNCGFLLWRNTCPCLIHQILWGSEIVLTFIRNVSSLFYHS